MPSVTVVPLFKTSFSHCYPDSTNVVDSAKRRVDMGQWVPGAIKYKDIFGTRRYDRLRGDSYINDDARLEFLGAAYAHYGYAGSTYIYGTGHANMGSRKYTDVIPVSLSTQHFSNIDLTDPTHQIPFHSALQTALTSYGIGYNQLTPKRQFSDHNFLYNPHHTNADSSIAVAVPVEVNLTGWSSSYNTGSIILSGNGTDFSIPSFESSLNQPVSQVNPGNRRRNEVDNINSWALQGNTLMQLKLGCEDHLDIDTRHYDNHGCDLRVGVYGSGAATTNTSVIPYRTLYLDPYSITTATAREFAVVVSLSHVNGAPDRNALVTEALGLERNNSFYTFIMHDLEPQTTGKLNINHVSPMQWKWAVNYDSYNRSLRHITNFKNGGIITAGEAGGSSEEALIGSSDIKNTISDASSYTIELWARVNDSTHRCILEIGDNYRGVYITSNNYRITVRVGDMYTYIHRDDISKKQWHHIAIVHDPVTPDSDGKTRGTMKLFVDGILYKYFEDDTDRESTKGENGWITENHNEGPKVDDSLTSTNAILYIGDRHDSVVDSGFSTGEYSRKHPFLGILTGIEIHDYAKYTGNFQEQLWCNRSANQTNNNPTYLTPSCIPAGHNSGNTIFKLDMEDYTNDGTASNIVIKTYNDKDGRGSLASQSFPEKYYRVRAIELKMEGIGSGFTIDVLGTSASSQSVGSTSGAGVTEYNPSLTNVRLDKDKNGNATEFSFPYEYGNLSLEQLLEKRLNIEDTLAACTLKSIPSLPNNMPAFINTINGATQMDVTNGVPGLYYGYTTIPIMGNISVDTVELGTTAGSYDVINDLSYPPFIHTFRPTLTNAVPLPANSDFSQQVSSDAALATIDDEFGTGPDNSVLTDKTGKVDYTITGDYTVSDGANSTVDLGSNAIQAMNVGICNAWKGVSAPGDIEVNSHVFDIDPGQVPVHVGVTHIYGSGSSTLNSITDVQVDIKS